MQQDFHPANILFMFSNEKYVQRETWSNCKEFVVPEYKMVPPPGYDPGSPNFQSGAMTTSAKAAKKSGAPNKN